MPEQPETSVVNFISIFLATASIITAFVIFLLQRKKKKLEYRVFFDGQVLTSTNKLAGKIGLTYNNIQVDNLRIVELMLVNTGNEAITTSEYEKQIVMSFEETKMLSAEVAETSPGNFGVDMLNDENELRMMPFLLNAGDSVVLRFILNGNGLLIVKGRIKNVKNITRMDRPKYILPVLSSMFGSVLFTIMLLLFVMQYQLARQHSILSTIILLSLGLSPMILLGRYIEKQNKKYRF